MLAALTATWAMAKGRGKYKSFLSIILRLRFVQLPQGWVCLDIPLGGIEARQSPPLSQQGSTQGGTTATWGAS